MRFAIRTTCGHAIGFGHLRRCLTLAEELQRRGHDITMWIAGDGSGATFAKGAGVAAESIADGLDAIEERLSGAPPRLLVLDDYALSGPQISTLRRSALVAVIEDLATRELDADLVLNGNANAATLDYRTGPRCTLLLGPKHSLLRPVFQRQAARLAPPVVRRGLIMLGGSDPRGLSARIAALFRWVIPTAIVDVVVGPLAASSSALDALTADGHVVVHRAPEDLLTLMNGADLAVSAGGQTNYELAAVGLPAVSICVADNQRGNIEALAAVPTLLALFDDDDATVAAALRRLAPDQKLRQDMASNGQRLVDGLGVVRVADALEQLQRKSNA